LYYSFEAPGFDKTVAVARFDKLANKSLQSNVYIIYKTGTINDFAKLFQVVNLCRLNT